VISLYYICIGRRIVSLRHPTRTPRALLRRRPSSTPSLTSLVALRSGKCIRGSTLLAGKLTRRRLTVHGAVIHVSSLSRSRGRTAARGHDVVGYVTIAALGVGYSFVVVGVGVFKDDVPGVDQAGEETKTAEGEVDEGIGTTDAAFDPYYGFLLVSGTFI